MKLLFIAADRMEYRGVLARLTGSRPVAAEVDWARRGRLGEHEVLLAANGVGWKRAAAAVRESARQFAPDAVVSTGFCGALDPLLQTGDVVSVTAVCAAGSTYPTKQPAGSGIARSGVLCSVDHVVETSREKAVLRTSGACAVEMEAAGVAAETEILRRPFYCVRAVTDLAGEDMANPLNAALRPDGHFDTMFVLKAALCHPAVRVPELVRLRNRCVRAARALGDFFADCRF